MLANNLLTAAMNAVWPQTQGADNASAAFNFREAVADETTQDLFLEALTDNGQQGLRYKICVIRVGVSKNNVRYTDSVLRESASLLEGVRVYVKSDEEHIKGQGRNFNQLIGQLSKPRFIEGNGAGYIEAELNVLQSAGDISARLLEAYNRKMTNLFGFSIDGEGSATPPDKEGIREAITIERFKSVDLIVEPGAGGELLSLLEAAPVSDNQSEFISFNYRTPSATQPTAFVPPVTTAASTPPSTTLSTVPTAYHKAINTAVHQAVQTSQAMREAISNSGLPAATQALLLQRFNEQTGYTTADVQTAIQEEGNYLHRLTEAGHVQGLGNSSWPHVQGGRDRADNVRQMLDDLMNPENGIQYSLREAYVEITGDRNVTGQMSNFDTRRYREAFANYREGIDSSTFGNALGDAIHREMLRLYQQQSIYDAWRAFAEVDRASDFRQKHLVRMAGYGDLPDVAEGAPYLELTTPDDEEATYMVSKKGGLEKLTLESVANDDVRLLRQIPIKLVTTAKRTLGKFAFNLISLNPIIYDGKPLFHVDHGNLGTAKLSKGAFSTRRAAMLKQTEAGSDERMSIPPKYLLVPIDLEEIGYDLFVRDTNNDPQYIQTVKPSIVPVWYWTRPEDWFLVADWRHMPGIVIGFLNGQQEPALYVMDVPNAGSVFSNDVITYKIKFIYGGAIVDYRALQGSIVP